MTRSALILIVLCTGALPSCARREPSGDVPTAAPAVATSTAPAHDLVPAADLIALTEFGSTRGSDRAFATLDRIDTEWDDRYAVILTELIGFLTRYPGRQRRAIDILVRHTGVPPGFGQEAFYQWVWERDPGVHPEYTAFRARLYEYIDRRFAAYFTGAEHGAEIRLDEIRWGGVQRDGIPPLNRPEMVSARDATYLAPTDVVFGVEIDGDARAYPKRILAWHEMFRDTVGGVSINGVYCTLCGSMIVYETVFDDVHHELGTSGFLYRSNKLMYDHATESLWSTITGAPVVGPLVDADIVLTPRPVVTTTWDAWRRAHPATTVLSIDTGFDRNYDEGAAYRDYFATDRLMFEVPHRDPRLNNKAEVLALRFGGPDRPAAIDVAFLSANPIYAGTHDDLPYVVLTDTTGANRVFEAPPVSLVDYDAGARVAIDAAGRRWRVAEDALRGPGDALRPRLPAHRAFWFGWFAAHPDTALVQ